MLHPIRVLVAALVVVTCQSSDAFSASIPNAGTLLKEQRDKPANLPDNLPSLEKKSSKPQTFDDKEATVTIKGFRFTNIESLATETELQELLKDAIGKKHGLTGLQELAGRVTLFLQDKGFFLARAFLPKQDITSGIIVISVLSGRLEGEVDFQIKAPSRIKESILKEMFNSNIQPGQALQNKQLERSLLLIHDLPGITPKATLERGTEYGSTKVRIDVEEDPLFKPSLSADIFGNYYTGTERANGHLTLNDPFGIGDIFSADVTGTDNLIQGSISYGAQLHPSGLKGTVSYDGLYYQLGEELEDLDADGRANTIGTALSYPLLRSRDLSAWSSLQYEFRMLDDYVLDTQTRDRSLHVGTLDLYANSYDKFAGGGLSSLQLTITAGDLTLGTDIEQLGDSLTAQTEGGYSKFTYSAYRLQRVVKNTSAFFSARGQLTGENLDSSEKFILGGPYGIRSYPVGEAVGDEGHSFTAELRYDVPWKWSYGTFQLVAFYDGGTITLHENEWKNSVSTASGDNSYWLSGAGLGVNLTKADSYAVRFSWARTIGDNPGESYTGTDADNDNTDDRFWLQANFSF